MLVYQRVFVFCLDLPTTNHQISPPTTVCQKTLGTRKVTKHPPWKKPLGIPLTSLTSHLRMTVLVLLNSVSLLVDIPPKKNKSSVFCGSNMALSSHQWQKEIRAFDGQINHVSWHYISKTCHDISAISCDWKLTLTQDLYVLQILCPIYPP